MRLPGYRSWQCICGLPFRKRDSFSGMYIHAPCLAWDESFPNSKRGTDELFFGTDSADSAFPTGTHLSGFSSAFPSATDDSSFPTETSAAITSGDNSSSLPSSTAAASSTNAFDTGIPGAGAAKSTASTVKASATKQGGGAAKSTTSAKPGNGNGAGAFGPRVAIASAAGLFALLGAMVML